MKCALIVLASIAGMAAFFGAILAIVFALGTSAEYIARMIGRPDLWHFILLAQFAVIGGGTIGASICWNES